MSQKSGRYSNDINAGKSNEIDFQKEIKKLRTGLNNFCLECHAPNPDWVSINNGIFLCISAYISMICLYMSRMCHKCVINVSKCVKHVSTMCQNLSKTYQNMSKTCLYVFVCVCIVSVLCLYCTNPKRVVLNNIIYSSTM